MLQACKAGTTILNLKASLNEEDTEDRSSLEYAHFDVKTEIDEFEKDLIFLKFIQSDDVYNVEQFLNVNYIYYQLKYFICFRVFKNITRFQLKSFGKKL